MAIQLQIRADAEEFSRYRDLVDSDWNKATFEAVLTLLSDAIETSISEQIEKASWLSFLKWDREDKNSIVVSEDIVEKLKFLSFVFRAPYLPKFPTEITSSASKLAAQTEAAIFYLLLQTMARLKGETDFFRDLQSLLYLNCVHYLLRHLKKNALKSEFDALVNVLHIHASVVWHDQPEQMFYLQAALMGELGHKKERVQLLKRSVWATPLHDHSYLTKANAYWGELLELGEKDEAMDFLLTLSRNAPKSYADELGEMIRETASLSQ